MKREVTVMGRIRTQLIAALILAFAAGTLYPQSDKQETTSRPAKGAQEPSSKQQVTPVFKVKTRLVMVDVVARDKSGHVLTDLRASDFKVTEDGKPQKISVFSFQHPRTEDSKVREKSPHADNVFNNKPKFQPDSSLNVVLLDALNTTFLNQSYVRVEMIKFLEKLPPGQPIAIYAMGRKLILLQDFTTDLTQLKNVIQTMKGESSHVLSDPNGTSEVPMTLQGVADQVAAEMAPGFRAQIQDFAEQNVSDQSDVRIQYTMAALMSLARMLAGYPGRKNLIWLSESVPFGIYPEAKSIKKSSDTRAQMAQESTPNIRNASTNKRDYVDQLTLLSNLLADAEVSVYPVDARGLVGSAFFNVATPVSGQGGMGGLANKVEGRQAEELFQAHYNMRDIAEKTGGLPFYNRNDLDVAVRQGIEDGSTYYSIGYYPEGKTWDGQFRKIRVSSTRSGVKLRYRLGYFAVDRTEFEKKHPEQRHYDLAAALNPDYPMATSIPFEAQVLPAGPEQNKLRINYAIDPAHISFERGEDALQRAQLTCAARVFQAKKIDHPVKSDATTVNAALEPEAMEKIRKSYFPCQVTFELPPAHYFLRLAVRDNTTGLMGTVNAEVTIPDLAAATNTSKDVKH